MEVSLYCSKCEKSFSNEEVQILKTGFTENYLCPQCGGPCFEEEAEEKGPSKKALLEAPQTTPWTKWAIPLAVVLAILAWVVPQYVIMDNNSKAMERDKKALERVKEKAEKGEYSQDLFAAVEVLDDLRTGGQ